MDKRETVFRVVHLLAITMLALESMSSNAVSGKEFCPASVCDCHNDIIDCSSRELAVIPSFMPSNITYDSLLIYNNKIDTIGPQAFLGIQFQRLVAEDNAISFVDDNAFSGLEDALMDVLLELSTTSEFPKSALQMLRNLQTLNIKNYGKPRLPAGALNNMPKLENLKLTNGQLSELSVDILEGGKMPLLRHLDLQYNQLTKYPTEIVRALPGLQSLCLEANAIKLLNTDVSGSVLEELDLSRNGPITIDLHAFDTVAPTLRKLDVSFTNLDDGHTSALATLTNLRELVISYNKISNINQLIRNMPLLVHLTANNNSIDELTRAGLQKVKDLLSINLSFNTLNKVEMYAFEELHALQELNLENAIGLTLNKNSFVRQRSTLWSLNLRSVSLAAPQWTVLEGMSALTSLSLDNCQLGNIPNFTFVGMHRLQSLSISKNEITELTQRALAGLEDSLHKLVLNNNKLTTIDRCAFYRFSKLTWLDLSNNPLYCSCQLKWLYEWTIANKNFLPWQCSDGRSVHDLTAADFQECSNDTLSECEEYAITTINPPTEPMIVLYKVNTTSTTASIRWHFTSGAPALSGVELHCSCYSVSMTLNVSVSEYQLTNLQPSSQYDICLQALAVSSNLTGWSDTACINVTTVSWLHDATMIRIIAAVACGAALLLIVVIIIYVMVRRARRRQQRILAALTQPKVNVGHTKHFKKTRPVSLEASMSDRITANHRQYHSVENQLDALTDDDRYKILALLTRSTVSLGNMDYCNVPGQSHHFNPMYGVGVHDAQEQEIYDEINDEEIGEEEKGKTFETENETAVDDDKVNGHYVTAERNTQSHL